MNKENILKSNGINPDVYNADKTYKIIKKLNVPYNGLTKDSILKIILSHEKGLSLDFIESIQPRKSKLKKLKGSLYLEKTSYRPPKINIGTTLSTTKDRDNTKMLGRKKSRRTTIFKKPVNMNTKHILRKPTKVSSTPSPKYFDIIIEKKNLIDFDNPKFKETPTITVEYGKI